ncbi:MAG: TIGR00282 family metallophosphoesterase [Oscillospiraceae bacterium]|nr:TIGR00282 family metallophosphoesterase [Oscillospiraceae bacterium]
MNIICIGDVVGQIGCDILRKKLHSIKSELNADLVIANGENACDGNGITKVQAEHIFGSGVDVITLGNHAFGRPESYEYIDNTQSNLVRPFNYPNGTTPGRGYAIVDMLRCRVAVINLLGNYGMKAGIACPFEAADEVLKIPEVADAAIKIIDFHAEATSEKLAMGYMLDGKVSAVVGTHTHVQTADDTILENGTAYITDLGMTGPIRSVLGVKPEISIKRLKTKLPIRYTLASGECKIEGVCLNIDEKTGKTIDIMRFRY